MPTAKEIIANIQKNHNKVRYEEEPWRCSNGSGVNKIYTTKSNDISVRLVVRTSKLASFTLVGGMPYPSGSSSMSTSYSLQLRNSKTRKEIELDGGYRKELVKLRKQFDKSLDSEVDI